MDDVVCMAAVHGQEGHGKADTCQHWSPPAADALLRGAAVCHAASVVCEGELGGLVELWSLDLYLGS